MIMEQRPSKSEIKRQYKQIEQLAQELAALSGKNIRALPCDDELRDEILRTHPLKGGARKRQIKYLARFLRQQGPVLELLGFLKQRKGSHLQETREFHELERFRDAILSAAIIEAGEAEEQGGPVPEKRQAEWDALATAVRGFPELDVQAVTGSARDFARTRNPRYRREVFRQLKAAMERQKFAGKRE
ncbi:MAG: DUF615 domain-containing protein [Desulfobacterales bacterium]|nr:DUF615 domain-containing protein [Desulfobacterales bacterium]